MNEIIGEMEKGWNEKIVFSVSEFKGKNYANIRIYYEDDEGEWETNKKRCDCFPGYFRGIQGKHRRSGDLPERE